MILAQKPCVLIKINKSVNLRDFVVWPGERDSNPWRLAPQRFSRPPLSTTQPSPEDCIAKYGGDIRIRTGDQGFAGPCLTAWLCRLLAYLMVPGAGLEPARKKNSEGF